MRAKKSKSSFLEGQAQCKGLTFEEFKKEAFKDPKFAAEYEALRIEFEALEKRAKARKRINPTS